MVIRREPEPARSEPWCASYAEHWSERGQRRTQPGSLNVYFLVIFERRDEKGIAGRAA
ncbi:hypothetical protein Desku_0186 [Desulfofundulus kuznetsovii DSM 6115]|uniref:Uncharacterized protein n=1 Tax=Desulfofundulus kuznetsovii (strain DSM 6115 / VKM B-1805 / 17) TaxID=760568 RepID=A0AAU8Q020_DESK7|nr:hypothetical protein Desku_0186 [Desulfofundulus kuznetsovii DSM 6115]